MRMVEKRRINPDLEASEFLTHRWRYICDNHIMYRAVRAGFSVAHATQQPDVRVDRKEATLHVPVITDLVNAALMHRSVVIRSASLDGNVVCGRVPEILKDVQLDH